MRFDDTIFALASAPGKAAIAVVRVSGGATAETVRALAGGGLPAPRQAELRRLTDPESGEEIDRALVLWFPGPESYSGEDVAEFHVHGGRAVVAAVLRVLGAMKDLRPAEAGEFSRRAFEHGKLDLTRAEGIADLVDAETEIQRRQALRQSGGALAALYDGWRQRLLDVRALIEATIDFSDQKLPDELLDPAAPEIRGIAGEIARHLQDDGWGERLRDGVQVAILGPVNAGKSSLINRLTKRDAAITGPEEGTTRDIIEVRLDLGGWPISLSDSAGLRAAAAEASALGDVEAEGIRRARARADEADLKIVLFDGARWPQIAAEAEPFVDGEALAVVNKCDLLDDQNAAVHIGGVEAVKISCKTGAGLDNLLAEIKTYLETRYHPSASPLLTRPRHRHALEKCLEALERCDIDGAQESAQESAQEPAQEPAQKPAEELVAEELRLAADALGRITGRVDVEKLLDIIFNDFCIGK